MELGLKLNLDITSLLFAWPHRHWPKRTQLTLLPRLNSYSRAHNAPMALVHHRKTPTTRRPRETQANCTRTNVSGENLRPLHEN